MKKLFLAISLSIALAGLALAQKAETRGSGMASSNTSANKQVRQLDLQSGAQMTAQLENTLDARHAKVGDKVELRTIQSIRQDGRVVVPKGARLIGHVTDVQTQTKSNGESRIGVVFDRLRTGSTETPITASILSIAQARSKAQASNNDLFEADTMTQSSSRSSATSSSSGQRSGGGLLGGVGTTVGGTLNTTTSTVGNVAGSTTNTAGSTLGTTTNRAGNATGNLSGALRGLQITQATDASAEGGSTLSLAGRSLRLESGTTFNLAVSSSTTAGNNP